MSPCGGTTLLSDSVLIKKVYFLSVFSLYHCWALSPLWQSDSKEGQQGQAAAAKVAAKSPVV